MPAEKKTKIEAKKLSDSYTNPDEKNIEKKLERLEQHCAKNKQDKRALRERSRIFSKLRRLKAYLNK